MSQEKQVTPPPVIWAQRCGILWVTICLEDCKDPTITFESDKIYFKGVGGTDRKEHEVTINLYDKIDPETVVQNAKGRLFELTINKVEKGPYWPRLTKENKKYHWLKIDFNKWTDENDSEDSDGEKPRDMSSIMSSMMGDMPPMKTNFDDLDDMGDDADDADSDDDEIPDLE